MRLSILCFVLLLTLAECLGQSTITTIIGANPPPDGGSATQSIRPTAFVQKSATEFLILDGNSLVWKLDGTGTLTRILGSGIQGTADTNDDPLTADLTITALAISAGGEIFFVDGTQIKKISATTGKIVLVAGTPNSGYGGDNGPASAAVFGFIEEIKFGPDGNLYVCDDDNYRIRKVNLSTNTVSLVAGNGSADFNGDNIAATSAGMTPFSIAFDLSGNLLIADEGRIRKITGGTVTTIAGDGIYDNTGDGGLATAARVGSSTGSDVVCDSQGNLYLSSFSVIRKISASNGIITKYAGTFPSSGYSGDGGLATSAIIGVSQLSVGLDNSLYLTQSGQFVVRKIIAGSGLIGTIAGNGKGGYYSGDGPFTSSSVITDPWCITFDSNGIMYMVSATLHRVFRLDLSSHQITTVAGTGFSGFSGDNGLATQAKLNSPLGVAVDASGNIYIADRGNYRIRKVAVGTGIITTIAGTGSFNYNGDNIQALAANIYPNSVMFDNSGRLIFSEGFAARIRRIDLATGIVTTIVGNGTPGYSGDYGPATSASINAVRFMDYTSDNQLYLAETFNHMIRKVDMTTGIISPVAGTTEQGFSGDDGPPLGAKLSVPAAVLGLEDGTVLIADSFNDRIRKVDLKNTITTVAGTGRRGSDGDGDATTHQLAIPRSLAINKDGEIFFSETGGNKIRQFTPDVVMGLGEVAQEDSDVRLYPVPVRTSLSVSARKQEIESIRILTSAGSPLVEVQVHGYTASLDFQSYPGGIYLVRVEQKNKITIKKVVHVDR